REGILPLCSAFRRNLLKLEEPVANHNSGHLLFGVHGYLRLSCCGFFFCLLFRSTLLGKVLRIDVDGRSPDGKSYHIPPDKPFVSDPKACPEVRNMNMWHCAVDSGDPVIKKGRGRIFCGDAGQNRFEEIDLWRAKEGFERYDTKLCHNSSMVNFLTSYFCVFDRYSANICHSGCESPSLNGLYIFGEFMSSRLMALQEDEKTIKWKKQDICSGSTTACAFPGMISSYSKFIISFAKDEAGRYRYFVSTSYPSAYAPHGSLYKLIDPARTALPGKCKYKPVPVKTKSKRIPFVPRASKLSETVLDLQNEPSTTMPQKRSSTLTAATPRVSSKKAKKTPTTKIKASTAKTSPPGKERQKTKVEAKPHKGKKIGHNSRTAPEPPLPKKKRYHLARSKEVLPKKAAPAKGKVEKRRKKQLFKLSDVPEKASSL
uniref:HHIP like 2 n=1 Tax=Cyanoderma ruficeps TaxID=181631 RepID=A0A8C3R3Z8_9PASS